MFADMWWQLCFVYSFVLAVNFASNGYFKADGAQLTFLRGFVGWIGFTLLLPFAAWPTEPAFYFFAVLAIIPAVIGDIIMYNAAARFGGAVISRILPLRIWLLFIVWSLFYPASFLPLLENPWQLFGIVASLIVGVLALYKMKADQVSGAALKMLIPTVLLYVTMDFFYKPAASLAPSFEHALALGFILCLVMWVGSGGYLLVRKRTTGILSRDMLIAGGATGLLYMVVILGKNLCLIGTPNPAYFNAISMLCAVWLTFYHKVRGIPDSSSIKAGLVFVLATLALILLTT